MKRTPLQRHTPLRRVPPRAPRRSISPATEAQRNAVREKGCLVCGQGPCDPAHLVDRSLAPAHGDDLLAVVPLCRPHHDAYDDHRLDLLPFLEHGARYRDEIAHATRAVGLLRALQRITGEDWRPVERPVPIRPGVHERMAIAALGEDAIA